MRWSRSTVERVQVNKQRETNNKHVPVPPPWAQRLRLLVSHPRTPPNIKADVAMALSEIARLAEENAKLVAAMRAMDDWRLDGPATYASVRARWEVAWAKLRQLGL